MTEKTILSKLWTAIRGHATMAGEEIADSQGTVIFEQEIKDAEKEISAAKSSLTTIMAQKKGNDREVSKFKKEFETYSNHAKTAKDAGNMEMATEAAEKAVSAQNQMETHEALSEQIGASIENLNANIKKADKRIASLKIRLQTVKTTEKVQKAQEMTSKQFGGSSSSASSALDSLARIEAKQQEKSDKMAAAEEMANESDPSNFEDRMRKQGLLKDSNSAEDLLKSL